MRRRVAWALGMAAAVGVVLIPAAAPGRLVATDTITVEAGKTVLSKLSLEPGTTYHAVISGTVRVEYPANTAYELRDPFYCYETNWKTGVSPGHCLGNKPTQEDLALEVHFGVGAKGCAAASACEIPLGADPDCKDPSYAALIVQDGSGSDKPDKLRLNVTGCASHSLLLENASPKRPLVQVVISAK